MNTRKKILIVDDEQINLEFFNVMLSKLGFEIDMAENGLEALEAVKKFSPDLIILDNIMPKMTGWEVTKTLKNSPEYAEWADIPIIMFSAMDDVKDKIEGFELGVDDYITKPYNFSEVLARIRAVLRNRELFAQIATRESRIAIEESFNAEVRTFVEVLSASLTELSSHISSCEDTKRAEELLGTINEKIAEAQERIKAIDQKAKLVEEEREKIKEQEIALSALETEFRKHLQQG